MMSPLPHVVTCAHEWSTQLRDNDIGQSCQQSTSASAQRQAPSHLTSVQQLVLQQKQYNNPYAERHDIYGMPIDMCWIGGMHVMFDVIRGMQGSRGVQQQAGACSAA